MKSIYEGKHTSAKATKLLNTVVRYKEKRMLSLAIKSKLCLNITALFHCLSFKKD